MQASLEVETGDTDRIGWRAYQLSMALATVAGVVAVLSYTLFGLMRDPPGTIGNMRGTSLAMLVLAVPLLVGSMVMTRRGSKRAVFGWLAAVTYLLYNAVLYCFALSFNPLFLLYVAMLSLAVWSLVTLVRGLDVDAIRDRAEHVPVRVLAIYMLASVALFGFAWLREILPAIVHNERPASFAGTLLLTSPVHVLDLAFTFPLLIVGAVRLWRRDGWGHVIAGTSILALTVETASIAIDQVYGHLHDPTQSTAAVPMMIAVTAIGAAMSIAFLRGLGARAPGWRLAVQVGGPVSPLR